MGVRADEDGMVAAAAATCYKTAVARRNRYRYRYRSDLAGARPAVHLVPRRRHALRPRRILTASLVVAAAVLACAVAALASAARSAAFQPPPDSLRALAAPIGLRIGTAVIPFDLDHPDYAAIAGDQFSTVTPGNEMKWQVVEPTRGSYDWSGADRLVAFADAHDQLVRGHTLLWHNQLPDWLTEGSPDGSIDNGQLRRLLHRHIRDEVSHFRGTIWQWDVANEFFTDSNPS